MRACLVLVTLVLLGCPKSNETADAGAPAASTSAAPPASQVTLAPLDETVSAPTASSTPPLVTTTTHPVATATGTATAKPTTTASAKPATPSAQAQLRQCCAAIRKQPTQDPNQSLQLQQAATLCDGLVAAMAGAPNMPALDGVKAMLAGVQLPPVCQGL